MALLERDREGQDIEDLLRAGGVLVVEGGAGIGKTSLVDVGCAWAGELGCETLRPRRVPRRPDRSRRSTSAVATTGGTCAITSANGIRRCHIRTVDTDPAVMSVASLPAWT